jgi:hypothetical protein
MLEKAALNKVLTQSGLGVGANGVKIVKIALAMAPFSNKANMLNEQACEKAIEEIKLILRGE